MEVKCTNKKCLYEWDYKGKASNPKDYITCPKCHYRIMLNKALDLSISHSLTHSLTHKQPVELPINIIDPIPSPYIEVPKEIYEEEEFLDYEELFTEIIIKLCKKHDLPARYNDYDLDWKCSKCIGLEIEDNIIGRKYKDVTSHLGEVRIIESDIEIYELSYPIPVKNCFSERTIHL